MKNGQWGQDFVGSEWEASAKSVPICAMQELCGCGIRASRETGVSLYKSDLCGIIIKNIRWKIKEILMIHLEEKFCDR